MNKIQLGFTVQHGEPFFVPLQHHMVITGMTNVSGKSTAVEAILHRATDAANQMTSEKRFSALVFLTKRGEKTFQESLSITPFYRERFDWEYVRSLLESSMKERMKFETPWIIRICKQAETSIALKFRGQAVPPGEGLHEVRRLLTSVLNDSKLKEWDRNIYTLLAAYLDKVLPILEEAQVQFSNKLTLKPGGINVMDLTQWYTHEEVQMLIIRSCMEEILKSHNNTIIGLPEAWKLLPQGRNTPVKLYFEKFIREGATNGNFLLIDAQDLGGIDKTPLRQVGIWIMGRMMQFDEVERLLKQTLGLNIKAEEIQTLPLGHFMVAAGNKVQKVYVWPYGVPEEMAIAVAKGQMQPESVKEYLEKTAKAKENDYARRPIYERDEEIRKDVEGLRDRVDQGIDQVNKETEGLTTLLRDSVAGLREDIKGLTNRVVALEEAPLHVGGHEHTIPGPGGNGTLTQTIRKVKVTPATLSFKLDTEKTEGKIMWLAKEGFLDKWRPGSEIEGALTDKGWGMERIKVSHALTNLVNQQFLGKRRTNMAEYKLAEFVKVE